MITKKKICNVCKLSKYIFSKGRCKQCTPIKPIKKKALKKALTKRHVLEKDAERQAQEKYWKSKAIDGEVYSENIVDGKALYLGREDEPNYYSICHIISKGSNPALRTDLENFILLSPEEHNVLDNFGGSSNLSCHEYIQKRIIYLKQKYSKS